MDRRRDTARRGEATHPGQPELPPDAGWASRWIDAVRWTLPRGRPLPDQVWARRHRAIVALVWLHALGLLVYALVLGWELEHAIVEGGLVALPALVASWGRLSRSLRASAASFGLVTASAVLVHLSGGFVEAHFHFFVVLGILALYQDWAPFLLAIGYVIGHHTVFGIIDPGSVFNHRDARANPFAWSLIHAAFVLAASVTSVVSWRFVERQSLRDPLTDLPNRALFAERLTAAIARSAKRDGMVAVLFIDLDDFKSVNDRLGHAAGDEVLRTIARRIKGSLRGGDTVARLGGDEFAVLLEDVREHTRPMTIADRVSSALTEPIGLAAGRVAIAASIGIAVNPAAGATHDNMLLRADHAMYRAKREERTRTAQFGPEVVRLRAGIAVDSTAGLAWS